MSPLSSRPFEHRALGTLPTASTDNKGHTAMAAQVQVERFDPLEGAVGFSFATKVGNTIYTAGCIGMEGATLEVPEDLETEARMAFDMSKLCLAGFGASLADVVDMTAFLAGDLAVVYPPFQKVCESN
jgi:enamine deaminase RidA (YjgF/YER057c/UK114 family)